ncbi:MAG: peptidyl-alpha-hydroxyglycine alpha-amidating lyase family protein [Bryobacteraceae bacterium]
MSKTGLVLACYFPAAIGMAQPVFGPLTYHAVADWPRLPAHAYTMETAGVAVTAQNHVYVFHRGKNPILEFDSDGWFLRGFGDGLFDRPHSIRIDAEGNIWTVDDGSHTVLKMDKHGRVRMVLGRYRTTSDAKSAMPDGSAGGALRGLRDEGIVRFHRPTDVAIGTGGEIFVADGYGNSRVVRFDKDGRFVKEWGKRGSARGEFHTPHSILADDKGRVYVADRENYRVQVFDYDGKFLEEWRDIGSPWGLAFTTDGNLMMTDGYNNRVVKLTRSGRVIGAFGSHGKQPGQFHYCHQMAVGPDGAVYTAEILNWRAQKFVLR